MDTASTDDTAIRDLNDNFSLKGDVYLLVGYSIRSVVHIYII